MRNPSAFLINQPILSPELVIFSSNMLSLINVIGKVRRTQDFLSLVKNIYFLMHGYSELLVIRIGPAHFLEKITMMFVLHSFIIQQTLFR